MEDKIEELKQIAVNEFERRGRVGVFRYYHGSKYVVEWDGADFDLFWSIWKTEKDLLKSLGFGVWKQNKIYGFIIFCELDPVKKDFFFPTNLWKKWNLWGVCFLSCFWFLWAICKFFSSPYGEFQCFLAQEFYWAINRGYW